MSVLIEHLVIGNLILFFAFIAVFLFEVSFKNTNLRHAYKLRLNLAIAALSASLFPLILAPFSSLISSLLNVNATDVLVSQYLKGNIQISATSFQDILAAKSTILSPIIDNQSLFSKSLIALFLLALVARGTYIAINIMRVRNFVSRSIPFKKTKKVDLVLSTEIEVPFSTRSLFRKYIVLPYSMLGDKSALEIAIEHEAQHIRQYDVDWEIFITLLSPLFCLNPAFWFVTDRIRRFREYNCDASVIRRDRFDAREYCLMLVNIAEMARVSKNRKSIALASSVPFFGRDGIFNRSNNSALLKRVQAISVSQNLQQKKMQKLINLLPALCLAVIMVSTVSFFAKPTDWSHDRLMLSTVVNLERLDRINSFGAHQ